MKTVILTLLLAAAAYAQPAAELYQNYCAGCHGAQMEGGQHSALRKTDWQYGGSRDQLLRTVRYGVAGTEMAAWSKVIPAEQVDAIVDYIIASRDALPPAPAAKPDTLKLQDYTVHIERLVTEGFRSAPWGIEWVDEHRALISEQRGGLRWLIDGKLDPEPITGTPETIQYGTGGQLDIALDPDYANNGWVYMGYVHPLGASGPTEERPAMTRIIRGRITDDHKWVEQELLFNVPDDLYFVNRGRWGCRLLFDKAGICTSPSATSARTPTYSGSTNPQAKPTASTATARSRRTTLTPAEPTRCRRSIPSATATSKASPSIRSPARSGAPSTAQWAATS